MTTSVGFTFTSSQALALRSKIVLLCADGLVNTHVAQRLGVSRDMVGKRRGRFLARRLEGLVDEPRPGAPRRIIDDRVDEVIVKTLEQQPANQGQSLVDVVDGARDRVVADGSVPDLAGVRSQAASGGHVEVVG